MTPQLHPLHQFSEHRWSRLLAGLNRLRMPIQTPRVRTPTVLQLEAVECGAAALGIILGYYRRFVPLAELRQECGVSRDGSQPANIVKAARRYGLRAKAFKKDKTQLAQMRLPVIVFWHFSHLVVVEGFGRDLVYLNDPATGPRPVSRSAFEAAYIGVVLVMEPGPQFVPGGRKPSVLQSLLERLKGSLDTLALTVFLGFLLVVPGLLLPMFSQVFVDEILVENRMDWLRPLLIGMFVTSLVQIVLFAQQKRCLRQLQIKLSAGMGSKFFWHLLHLPVSFYTQRFPGEIAGRVKLNEKVAQAIAGSMAETLINGVMAVIYLLVMLSYSLPLTAIALGLATLNILALVQMQRWLEERYMQIDKDDGKLDGIGIAGIQSMETLKASALESDFFSRWAGYLAKSANNYRELAVVYEVLQVLPVLLTALTVTLILAVGGWQIMAGHMTIGGLVAFQALLHSFQTPINRLVSFAITLPTLAGNVMRLDDVLVNAIDPALDPADRRSVSRVKPPSAIAQPLVPRQGNPGPPLGTRLHGHLEVRDLTFAYAQVNEPLLSHLSCVIQPGQRVALVGGSGSGKSTVARLVAGLYQPWSGEILLDGWPLAAIARSQRVRSVAMVEQEVFLFAGSVRDNLTLWDASVADAQLHRACRDAGIHEVILAMPKGYNSKLLEGGINLSGGQRQRLEIARSLLHDPTLLILDEATSALESATEALIYQSLRQRGCSCLIVAHRISSIQDCDQIIVLDRGTVVQRGSHAELMQMGGLYAELVQSEQAEAPPPEAPPPEAQVQEAQVQEGKSA